MRAGRRAALGLVLCAAGLAARAEPVPAAALRLGESGFALKLPSADPVRFRGRVSGQGAVDAGAQVMYPAAGVAGFLAAIAAHGALAAAQRSSAVTRQQAEADRVLEPYRGVLDPLTHRQLLQDALAGLGLPGAPRLVEAGTEAGAGWVIETVPVFTMTQDRRALLLDNAVTVYRAEAPQPPRWQQVVRAVSAPLAEDQGATRWGDPAGRLRQDSVALYAHTLRLVLDELARPEPGGGAQRTFRYAEGGEAQIERAEWVADLCRRTVVRTLRGELMSIPAPASPAACDQGVTDRAEILTGLSGPR